jgi:hypothetical protein
MKGREYEESGAFFQMHMCRETKGNVKKVETHVSRNERKGLVLLLVMQRLANWRWRWLGHYLGSAKGNS